MSNITLIYYTANRIHKSFALKIRENLQELADSIESEIISVSWKPIDFGRNICVGELEFLPYNVYKQILIGSKAANTEYIGCCEDDSLYNIEHFSYRSDCFSYNVNRWNVDSRGIYYYRRRSGMCMCVVPKELLIETLEKRFEKYPKVVNRDERPYFGEPGRYEEILGLPEVKMETFTTNDPTLTFNHRPSLGGKRKILKRDIVKKSIPFWGDAETLWREYYK